MRYMENVPQQIAHSIESFKFKEGLNSWIDLARQGNKYLTETEPWHLIKTNPDSVQTILYLATQMMAQLAILGEPFLPFTSQKLATMLRLDTLLWHRATRPEIIPPGTVLQQPVLLFQRIENDMLPIS
jgi:methionyl-tRNA synthetase